MKKIATISILFLFCLTIFNSCSTRKQSATIETKNENNFKDFSEPLTDEKYRTDKDYFRARGVGEVNDVAFCEKLGEQDARSKIANMVEITVQSLMRTYSEKYKLQNVMDFAGKSDELVKTITNKSLEQSRVLDFKKQFNSSTGVYRYYCVIEMPTKIVKEAIVNEIRKNVPEQERARVDENFKSMDSDLDEAVKSQQGKQ